MHNESAAQMLMMSTTFSLVTLAVLLIMVISFWRIFAKAGKAGWAAIIPIYNLIVFLEIVEKPIWWIILMLIPIVNVIISIILYIELARKFDQGAGFAVGMIFLPYIFFPILAFGNYEYVLD